MSRSRCHDDVNTLQSGPRFNQMPVDSWRSIADRKGREKLFFFFERECCWKNNGVGRVPHEKLGSFTTTLAKAIIDEKPAAAEKRS